MGIKSFQGARRQQTNDGDTTPLKVIDYMTKSLITFTIDQPIESVMQILLDNRISGGPVVNEKNELIGLISETDCIKHISESRYYNMPLENQTIEKYVTKNVDTIDAATTFIQSKRRRFPVVNNGKLVGQISQSDLLRAAMELKGQNWL